MLNVSFHRIRFSRWRAGFTLIELLVTVVIGALLIAFLFQLFNATVGAWHSGESQNDTFREARAAMQLMERDISQTTAALPVNAYSSSPTPTPGDGVVPVLVLDRYPPPVPTPASQLPAENINEELYCLTNIPNNGSSSLCAVGYFCSWMPDLYPTNTRVPHAYALIRQFLGSGSATTPGLFDRLKAANASGRTVLTFNDLYERLSPPLAPGTPTSTATATELCSYVWDLQFRTPASLQATPSPAVYRASPTPYPAVLPPYIEVRFKALSAGAARKLEGNASVTRETWRDPTLSIYKQIIQPGTRQFVTRVPLYSGSSTSTP